MRLAPRFQTRDHLVADPRMVAIDVVQIARSDSQTLPKTTPLVDDRQALGDFDACFIQISNYKRM